MADVNDDVRLGDISLGDFRIPHRLPVRFLLFRSKQPRGVDDLESILQILRAIDLQFVRRFVLVDLHRVFQPAEQAGYGARLAVREGTEQDDADCFVF